MPIGAAVVKILIFGDETIDFGEKDPDEPIYIYQHIDNLTGHNDGAFYDLESALDCSLNYLSVRAYPDSYFTMEMMGVDYKMNYVDGIGDNLTGRCFPRYETIDTASDEIATASDIINNETDVLNGVISNAMWFANSGNTPRRKIPTDAVYGVASKAKLIITNATNTFNINTVNAKTQLNAGIAAAAAQPTTIVEFKPLDPELLRVYAQTVRFLENGINKGRVPFIEKNPLTGQRGKVGGIQTNENLWTNYAYPDKDGNPTLGIGHLLSSTDTSVPLSNGPALTGFWPKLTPDQKKLSKYAKFPTISTEGPGVSTEQLDALFVDDLAPKITDVQFLLGVKRWNYLWDNDPCIIIVLIDIQYNSGKLRTFSGLLNDTLGLQMESKNPLLLLSTGHYIRNIWTKPSTYKGTQAEYIIAKKAELQVAIHRKESQVGAQRNDAIFQLFVDKTKSILNYKGLAYFDNKGNPVNYWTICNPTINNVTELDLTKYMKLETGK
jgi:hypothetical protein